jgi:hypothetical protein
MRFVKVVESNISLHHSRIIWPGSTSVLEYGRLMRCYRTYPRWASHQSNSEPTGHGPVPNACTDGLPRSRRCLPLTTSEIRILIIGINRQPRLRGTSQLSAHRLLVKYPHGAPPAVLLPRRRNLRATERYPTCSKASLRGSPPSSSFGPLFPGTGCPFFRVFRSLALCVGVLFNMPSHG